MKCIIHSCGQCEIIITAHSVSISCFYNWNNEIFSCWIRRVQTLQYILYIISSFGIVN